MTYDGSPQGPVDRRSRLLAIQVSLISLATLVVALRLFTRIFVLRSPGWDDLAISVGLVSRCGRYRSQPTAEPFVSDYCNSGNKHDIVLP